MTPVLDLVTGCSLAALIYGMFIEREPFGALLTTRISFILFVGALVLSEFLGLELKVHHFIRAFPFGS